MCGYILQDITVNILSAAAPQDIAQSRCRGLTGSITSAWRFQYTLSARLHHCKPRCKHIVCGCATSLDHPDPNNAIANMGLDNFMFFFLRASRTVYEITSCDVAVVQTIEL